MIFHEEIFRVWELGLMTSNGAQINGHMPSQIILKGVKIRFAGNDEVFLLKEGVESMTRFCFKKPTPRIKDSRRI